MWFTFVSQDKKQHGNEWMNEWMNVLRMVMAPLIKWKKERGNYGHAIKCKIKYLSIHNETHNIRSHRKGYTFFVPPIEHSFSFGSHCLIEHNGSSFPFPHAHLSLFFNPITLSFLFCSPITHTRHELTVFLYFPSFVLLLLFPSSELDFCTHTHTDTGCVTTQTNVRLLSLSFSAAAAALLWSHYCYYTCWNCCCCCYCYCPLLAAQFATAVPSAIVQSLPSFFFDLQFFVDCLCCADLYYPRHRQVICHLCQSVTAHTHTHRQTFCYHNVRFLIKYKFCKSSNKKSCFVVQKKVFILKNIIELEKLLSKS